ncbi:DUF3047 domain-containing protein [Granulosicoccus antarcticus]|uniref:DUF3047 domain-containing protein n=1 Tax=Granulosicoccus antarcticus IMCC3135 TaxID=1192854 RepID=A0A2Z2NUC6_9GAMM|nr:DUF3047 domain-containing protein [Granulosicoccus antarcticus]ASJ75106.1 hypothetical protein IMCC3135_25215 [Granulosicoccus antarcticus IMCC3135]
MATTILGFGWLMLASSSAPAATGQISGLTGEFSSGSLSGWKERSFAGNSKYELIEEQGTQVLQGSTNGKASILYTEQKVDLKTTPLIEWSWKVDRTYEGIDQRSRQGDDFPARLYVVAKTGFLPWDTLAINYVWSTDAPLDDSWANPFTDKAHMVVVQTGNQRVGSWVTQQRNIAEDFKTYFGADIKQLSGYAVMIDGDNANKEGMAWFGKIQFSAN